MYKTHWIKREREGEKEVDSKGEGRIMRSVSTYICNFF